MHPHTSMPAWRIQELHFVPSLSLLYYSIAFNVPFCCFATFGTSVQMRGKSKHYLCTIVCVCVCVCVQ